MVDMHIHTLHSDGLDSVERILEMANSLKITTISITDHNTVSAYDKILQKDLMKLYDGDLVPGVELKCHINKEIIELLIYDFDIDKMKKFINKNYHEWEYINKNMSMEFEKILIKNDLKYDKSIIVSYDFNKYNGIMELYKSVIENSENHKKLGADLYKDIPEFSRKCVCDVNNRFYIDLSKYYPSAEDVINFIRLNDGMVFMPHVYLFNNGFNILKLIKEKYKLDGIECYHPSYTLNQCDELINYCKDNNLLISAGSDYHGSSYGLGNTSEFYDNKNISHFVFKNCINRK
jgi:hypothetical protein